MKVRFLIALNMLIFTSIICSQDKKAESALSVITRGSIEAQLEFLASDWMEGRETGTKGAYMAADYIASMFKSYGLKPAGDIDFLMPTRAQMRAGVLPSSDSTYFQNFSLLDYKPGDKQILVLNDNSGSVTKSINFNYRTDFTVTTGSIATEVEAPVVFVGYGYKNEQHGYNDFEDVNVKGRFILRLAGFPGHNDTSSQAYKKFADRGRYSAWYMRRDKNDLAEKLGAVGVIEVDLENDQTAGWAENYPFRYNKEYYEGEEDLRPGQMNRMTLLGDSVKNNLPVASVTKRFANDLTGGTDISFEKFEELARSKLKSSSSIIKNKTLFLKTDVVSKIVKVRNVLAKIEGENKDEIIVVGAHYDHLGTKNGYIWNGSDDNASGTVGILTMAKAAASTGIKPKRTIIFAAWTGEEKGLLGSRYFADNYNSINDIVFYLNYDMISRNEDNDSLGNRFSASFSEDYPVIRSISEKFNTELSLGLDINYRGSKRPGGGSDHASFSAKDIPVMYYFAGFHPDYHGISDHSDKANYNKMEKVIKLGFSLVWELANQPDNLSPQTE
ncbi:MAG: M20/M25/M40 family metallo-hydrolase [Melioribacteraceae bacterium]|nr:M20/M25/M40 family metallo-hydrolase [Melioribacteraceae bacterium]